MKNQFRLSAAVIAVLTLPAANITIAADDGEQPEAESSEEAGAADTDDDSTTESPDADAENDEFMDEKLEEVIEDAKDDQDEPQVGEASYNVQDCEEMNEEQKSDDGSVVSKELDDCEKTIK